MTRAWIAVALLSAAWLSLSGYYHQPDWLTGSILLCAAITLLATVPAERRAASTVVHALPAGTPWRGLFGAALLVPAVAVAPWPYKIAPLLLLVGLAIVAALALEQEPRRPWSRLAGRLSGALIAGGGILLAQSLTFSAYEAFTARSHELPSPLSQALARLANLAGIHAAVDGSNNIVMYVFRLPQRLGATWELLVDPVTLAFAAGGLVLLAIRGWDAGASAWRSRRGMAALLLCLAGWLPMRAVLLTAIYMHRLLRTDYDASVELMGPFWSTWAHLLLLGGPIFLVSVFVRGPRGSQPPTAEGETARQRDKETRRPGGKETEGTTTAARRQMATERREDVEPAPRRKSAAVVLAALGVAAISAGIFWNPPGERKGGRVLVDEYHSQWEDTRRPFDTTWYGHESTYQFSAAFDYLGRFYQTGRIEEPITSQRLANCDVLILKVPTTPYSQDEIRTIRDFVERGGGLLAIGEHTNVFGTGTFLNEVTATFGFRFRYDCVFDIDRKFLQSHRSAVVPHPVLAYLPQEDGQDQLDWVVSCSVDPGSSAGRGVIRSVGLKNLPVDYYASNFYPQVYDHAYMRYGAFTQVWATRHGKGRVIGFGDSTQLSNFCVFEPGKIDLQLGMIEWLNHRPGPDPRGLLVAGGAAMLLLGLGAAHGWAGGWLVMLAAGLLGWAVAVVGVNAAHAAQMPSPPQVRPMVRVAMDRTVSGGKLPMGGFISGEEDGFGIFEMWILRLGYFTSRRSSVESFGDCTAAVFVYPNKAVSDELRAQLRDYVEQGGRLLVIDAPENKSSTANGLLLPFGMNLAHQEQVAGDLTVPEGWPAPTVTSSCTVSGGQALATIHGLPVAAFTRLGKGSVTVVGLGSRFSDRHMGIMANIEPQADLLQVFELGYALMRAIVNDTLQAVPPAASQPAAP